MVLNPLADVGVRMFVTIRIGRGEFMMNILGYGEWSQSQDDTDHSQCDPCTE
jgi:hypothetical protein